MDPVDRIVSMSREMQRALGDPELNEKERAALGAMLAAEIIAHRKEIAQAAEEDATSERAAEIKTALRIITQAGIGIRG